MATWRLLLVLTCSFDHQRQCQSSSRFGIGGILIVVVAAVCIFKFSTLCLVCMFCLNIYFCFFYQSNESNFNPIGLESTSSLCDTYNEWGTKHKRTQAVSYSFFVVPVEAKSSGEGQASSPSLKTVEKYSSIFLQKAHSTKTQVQERNSKAKAGAFSLYVSQSQLPVLCSVEAFAVAFCLCGSAS